MPSLLSLPSELLAYIVEILVGCDIESACSLLQSSRSLRQSHNYDRVRYLCLWDRSGFPRRSSFPTYLENEVSLLRANRWPRRSRSDEEEEADKVREKSVQHKWYEVPSSIAWHNTSCRLSRQARLLGDRIYDISNDGHVLCTFRLTSGHHTDSEERLSKPAVYPMEKSIVSYDVELDEAILVLLMKGRDSFLLSVRHTDDPSSVIQEITLDYTDISPSFSEISAVGKSILVSLDNQISIYDWKTKPAIHRTWSRGFYPAHTYTAGGWYIRAHLLSAEVVSCIVLWTHRTIGSMRVSSGVLELYRLDQHNPLVALNKLCESSVDVMQPRYLQEPYLYISIQCGGKQALRQYMETGMDQPCLIQSFGDVRIGGMSALADVIHPRAALALYSEEHPILPQEWLRGNFRLISDGSPLQSSLHGRRMISCLKRGKPALLYWTSAVRQGHSRGEGGMQLVAQEDLSHLLAAHRKTDEDLFHVDLVSLDGPRALFTLFRCEVQHNGTLHATEPVCSFWSDFEPSHP